MSTVQPPWTFPPGLEFSPLAEWRKNLERRLPAVAIVGPSLMLYPQIRLVPAPAMGFNGDTSSTMIIKTSVSRYSASWRSFLFGQTVRKWPLLLEEPMFACGPCWIKFVCDKELTINPTLELIVIMLEETSLVSTTGIIRHHLLILRVASIPNITKNARSRWLKFQKLLTISVHF